MDDMMLMAIYYITCVIVMVLFVGLILIYLTSGPPKLDCLEGEQYYKDPKTKTRNPFPSLLDRSSIDLSVIVPSYNEEERLPVMMNETMDYLKERQERDPRFKYEIIVVDDGSKDKTSEVALRYSEKYGTEKVRVLTLLKNRGKGGAVRMGMFSSRGRMLLFADADGATKFSDLDKLEEELEKIVDEDDNTGVVCGSRAHLEKDAIATRSLFRTILMKGFHFLVWVLCVRGIRDTQCGFKLMTRSAARVLFFNLHVERWAFDVDMLHIAQVLGIPLGEVAVTWQEIDGSKMVPVFSWIQMGKDILLIRLRYFTGAWTIKHKIN